MLFQIQPLAFKYENVVCKAVAILFKRQCVSLLSGNPWRDMKTLLPEEASRACISNCILQNIVECNDLSIPYIPAFGTKVLK